MSRPSEERLAWLTGFTGSAGLAVVLAQEAALFVDGRYTLQAAKQVDGKAWTVESLVEPPPETLARETSARPATASDLIRGCTPSAAAERMAAACAKAGAELVAVESNPVDSIWTERPPPPLAPVAVHGARFAGEAEADKLGRIRDEIGKARRGRAGAVRQPRRGLDLQHPRRRCRAYAAAAVLRAGAEGRPADGVHRSPQALQRDPRPSRAIRRCARAGSARRRS